MLLIDDLWVMQQTVMRGSEQIQGMIDYVKRGGHWTLPAITSHALAAGRKAAPIYITLFPDGIKMIHDGHKRVMATAIANRHYLHESEYTIAEWSYESYQEIVPERGFVTPFDPITEVRKDDFGDYKNVVLAMAKTNLQAAINYVWANHDLYAEPREIKTVKELAQNYLLGYNLGVA